MINSYLKLELKLSLIFLTQNPRPVKWSRSTTFLGMAPV